MSKSTVKATLVWLQRELENNFTTQRSGLQSLKQSMPGNSGYSLIYDSTSICAVVQYWDTGVLNIAACNVVSEAEYMDFWYTPNDFRDKFYPAESERVMVEKINELLSLLHTENPSIALKVPEDIA